MNIKNFIKKRMEKDSSLFILRIYQNQKGYTTERINITHLTKFLKDNEKKIERIDIRLILN